MQAPSTGKTSGIRLLTGAAVGYRRFRCQHGSWPIANRPQIHNPLHKGYAGGDYLVVTVASPARRPSPVAVIFTRPALPRSPRTINRAKPLNALRWSAWKDSTVAALPLSTPAILAGPSRANFPRLSAVGQKLPSLSSTRTVTNERSSPSAAMVARSGGSTTPAG